LDALEYLNFVATERKNSAKTRHRKLASLKTFFKCLHRDINLIPENPLKDIDYPKSHAKLPKYLTLNESVNLLRNIDENGPYFDRDYCILTLFINCGMRLSELTGLNIQDINLDERSMRLLGKGNKERIIHINDACAFALDAYLKIRNPSKDESIGTNPKAKTARDAPSGVVAPSARGGAFETNPKAKTARDAPSGVVAPSARGDKSALFLSKRGGRISNRRVEQIVENAFNAINLGNQGFSVHKLRHTAATLMYQHGGADTNVLKEILGHQSVSTTEIYTHVSDERVKTAMDANPLANIKRKQKRSP
jgi:site-specific recombinase XerD